MLRFFIFNKRKIPEKGKHYQYYWNIPVKYSPSGDVQVQSGDPNRRENTHSKCRVEAGKMASSPPGSKEPDPEGIRIRIEGGESSAIKYLVNCRYKGLLCCKADKQYV